MSSFGYAPDFPYRVHYPNQMKRSILMLEHDDDDRYITRAVFEEQSYPVSLDFVDSSDELFAFLLSCEKSFVSFPSLILLNQHATPLNAVDILRDLKAHPQYGRIPVVVLSGTVDDEVLRRCYDAGANSVIHKPSSALEVSRKIAAFVNYWFQTVELPR